MKVKSLIKELYSSPIGELEICSTSNGIVGINFASLIRTENIGKSASNIGESDNDNKSHSAITSQQLDEYFSGKRQEFKVDIELNGTDFQKKVWKAILEIPHGETLTYSQIAKKIGKPNAARAVGMACNKNPLLLVIPCHRVIGANGVLTGYAGGLIKKQWLLEHEKAI